MTDRKKKVRLHSLNVKIVLVTLLALICGIVSFYVTYAASTYFVDSLYMSDSSVSARKAKLYTEFYRYVNANSVSGRDTHTIALWSESHNYVSVHVYASSSDTVLRSVPAADVGSVPSTSQYSGQYGKLYPMKFADGVYQIAIEDSSRDYEVFINLLVSIAISVIVFITVVLLYTMSLTNRIIVLSRQAYYIANGDLDAPLTTDEDDELTVLADNVNNLRNSVVEKMTNEHEAWKANSDLITAISHDIRTPMTSLIGYLTLLSEDGFQDKEKCAVFTRSAASKANELKNLTDELFRYFLVFGNTDPKLENDSYDGVMLLGQLLSEAEFDLTGAGYTVEVSYPDSECTVFVDPMYLKRVLDNMTSNIKKYADRSCPLRFSVSVADHRLRVEMSNTITPVPPSVESNKIGLKTCKRIMELLGGTFSTETKGRIFTAAFSLPVKN